MQTRSSDENSVRLSVKRVDGMDVLRRGMRIGLISVLVKVFRHHVARVRQIRRRRQVTDERDRRLRSAASTRLLGQST